MSKGVAFLLYAILDALTDSYFSVLDTIDDLIDELEVVEQDQPRRDPMESVAISFANLAKLTAGVGLEA